jgi:hypothetical protein
MSAYTCNVDYMQFITALIFYIVKMGKIYEIAGINV